MQAHCNSIEICCSSLITGNEQAWVAGAPAAAVWLWWAWAVGLFMQHAAANFVGMNQPHM
jgi:hypothetical protein